MISGKWKNFNKMSYEKATVQFDYDYDSIMHYGPLYFRYV